MDESDKGDETKWREVRGKVSAVDGDITSVIDKSKGEERKWLEEKMKFRGKVEKETIEKLIKEQIKELVRKSKEDTRRRDEKIKKQRKEIKSLKRKVHRLEQGAGKRKRKDSEESRSRQEEGKWWTDDKKNDEERRKKNVILRIEKDRWSREGTSWEKVRKLFAEGLKIKTEMKEMSVIGQKDWIDGPSEDGKRRGEMEGTRGEKKEREQIKD